MITRSQFGVLSAVRTLCREKGYTPSFQEIAAAAGYTSLATVFKHLDNLQKKGFVTRGHNSPRSLAITRHGMSVLRCKATEGR
jgi:repressor LexA